jgi:hypothetical protein
VTILLALLAFAALGLFLLPACRNVEDARAGGTVSERLKQLVRAMHSYQDEHHALPPHTLFDKEGKPLLSWRVLLLPYLEQKDLFERFKLDEPWDSQHNRRLLDQMPAVYLHPWQPASETPGMTRFQVFVGRGAAFEGQRGLRLPKDFPDGSSNTILIAEAARAVPWTRPEDLPYDPDRPVPRLGDLLWASYFVAFADGSARRLSGETSEATLRALITRNGGDEPGPDW